ncbi:MAG: hypothetical protein VZQ62_00310 [Methanosphaera sp.]|nr:hypothetical protein [Methanosphaera sp.]
MANKGREYAENLVGALDRSAYGKQREVAQSTYNTNWQNVQNQYKNLQDKLKLQQQRANRDFAEGLVDVAENSFNRQRIGSGNLANRGLAASGLTNMLNQADTAQKGEDISKLLKSAGDISASTADKLGQATSKAAQEETNLMNKLYNTLADIGDAETAAQNRYNQTLASIAGAMDEREMNNALQAAQRAASRGSSGKSSAQVDAENELEEFYKRAAISEVLASPDMTDTQKSNYLGIMFGINGADNVVDAYNRNVNATSDYNAKYKQLKKAADKEALTNKQNYQAYNRNLQNKKIDELFSQNNPILNRNKNTYGDNLLRNNLPNMYNPSLDRVPTVSVKDAVALQELENKGITYEDLAALLYGIR